MKVRLISLLIAIAAGLLLGGCTSTVDDTVFNYPQAKPQTVGFDFYSPAKIQKTYSPLTGEAKNVIFLIGDGMGFEQVKLAHIVGTKDRGMLYMESLPVKGEVKTRSASSSKTDSAAAATALACGIKTKNKRIGQCPEGDNYMTILELAQGKGKLTGLVASSMINHATPACFAAHTKSRNSYPEIAEQLVDSKVNVLFGGGRKYFDGKRAGQVKLAGYQQVNDKQQMQRAKGKYVLGLFADEHLTTTDSGEPTLREMTRKALDLLDNSSGFFLMVEGSQIDFAGHSNDADEIVRQTLEFDLAVKEAIDFALADGQTLVIVTADHETGGLKVEQENGEVKAKFSTLGHTGVNVPIFAFGPGAGKFTGVLDNTEIPIKIAQIMGLGSLPRKVD